MSYEEFINSIRESRENKWFDYSERHHIVPRCMGGQDIESNLIYLTLREHFIAHKLLSEENPDNLQLFSAYWRLSNDGRHTTPGEYEEARLRFIERNHHSEEWRINCSEWMTGRKQCLGKIWIHNSKGDTLMINPEFKDEYLAKGWVIGRGSFHSDETKEYCRKVTEGRVWITNGIKSKMIYLSTGIPEGWRRGRLIKQDERGRIIGNGDKE